VSSCHNSFVVRISFPLALYANRLYNLSVIRNWVLNIICDINIMSRPFKLYRLQQIDSQIDSIQNRLEDIDVALKEDTLLNQTIHQAENASSVQNEARKNLRRCEDDVRQQQIKIEQTEATLYGGTVRNPKELQDLQNDVSALKRHLVVLEDRLLESMMVEEDTSLQSSKASAELEKTRAHYDRHKSELLDEQKHALKDRSHLEEERLAALGSINLEDLNLYNKLRQQRRGIAVSKVSERACSACGSILSAALLHLAHSPTQITRCETCGRILYLG
jgi:predicted  nucleic acid-binding Zn-ribbon protein